MVVGLIGKRILFMIGQKSAIYLPHVFYSGIALKILRKIGFKLHFQIKPVIYILLFFIKCNIFMCSAEGLKMF